MGTSICCVWCAKPLVDVENAKTHVRKCRAAPWTAEIVALQEEIRVLNAKLAEVLR